MRLIHAAGRRLPLILPAGILLGAIVALGGCATTGTMPSAAETEAAQQAAALATQGQFQQAAQDYLTLAAQAPARADHYRLLAAEDLRQNGSMDQVAKLAAQIDRAELVGDEPLRLDLLRAELALRDKDAATALKLTTQPEVAVPERLKVRLYTLRAEALQDSGDDWAAARTRMQLDGELGPLDQSANHDSIVALLTRLGADPLKQRAAAMKPGDPMLPWVNEALSKLGVAVARPQPTLGQPVGTLLPGADANVREGYQVPKQIALLLPESGPIAAAGTAIREGFFAAYAEAAQTHAPRPQVRVYDSAGTAAGATAAYRQAVADGAQLVVGPLTRPAVAAIFALPQRPAPVLALNHPDTRNLPPANASEFGLLPETEGAQVADHMVERGLRSAYVLISGDDFAQRAADAFKAEFFARGGQVVGTAKLPDSGYNDAAAIASLGVGATPPDNAGLFISMRPQQARILLPQLKIARLDLPVFATSHVYAGSDDAAADNDLNGVEFCDAPWLFDAQTGLPSHVDLGNLLPDTRGVAARLFAFGMDAWNLVPYLDWMRAHPGSYLPGASGQLTADQFGRIRRVLIWARFDNGLARPVTGSLQLDDAPSLAPASGAPASGSSVPAPAVSAPAPASSSVPAGT